MIQTWNYQCFLSVKCILQFKPFRPPCFCLPLLLLLVLYFQNVAFTFSCSLAMSGCFSGVQRRNERVKLYFKKEPTKGSNSDLTLSHSCQAETVFSGAGSAAMEQEHCDSWNPWAAFLQPLASVWWQNWLSGPCNLLGSPTTDAMRKCSRGW